MYMRFSETPAPPLLSKLERVTPMMGARRYCGLFPFIAAGRLPAAPAIARPRRRNRPENLNRKWPLQKRSAAKARVEV
jgi:hypothetical protein